MQFKDKQEEKTAVDGDTGTVSQKISAERDQKQSHNDFAFTMFAAKRSRQRSLIAFVRMADYMLGSTLHSLLFDSCHSVVQNLEQRMCSLSERDVMLDARQDTIDRLEAAATEVKDAAAFLQTVRTLLQRTVS